MNVPAITLISQSEYTTYRWLKNEDFTAFGHHYGGNILKWAEEEAGLFAVRQLGTFTIATVGISNVTFPQPLAKQEEVLRLDIHSVRFGASSIRFAVQVSAASRGDVILDIGQITVVQLSPEGRPFPHTHSTVIAGSERLVHAPKPFA